LASRAVPTRFNPRLGAQYTKRVVVAAFYASALRTITYNPLMSKRAAHTFVLLLLACSREPTAVRSGSPTSSAMPEPPPVVSTGSRDADSELVATVDAGHVEDAAAAASPTNPTDGPRPEAVASETARWPGLVPLPRRPQLVFHGIDVQGPLSPVDVQRVVHGRGRQLEACYVAALKGRAPFDAEVELDFTIDAAGLASALRIEAWTMGKSKPLTLPKSLETCWEVELDAMRFAAPTSRVSVRFEFQVAVRQIMRDERG
jgi:hypothetical protein